MARPPYSDLPDSSYWRRAVGGVAPEAIDPVVVAPFQIGARTKVAAAGSCFAQHIGRYLKAAGCAYLVTETAHPVMTEAAARALNYGVYTARTGNIYTARQLRQLIERAYGRVQPADDIWDEGGLFLDPFRPTIQPGGFNSRREFEIDRIRHFSAVRQAFETLDVLVFTLGLTEAWRSRVDGIVYPLCPGVSGGKFSPGAHEFVNFGVADVVDDLAAVLQALKAVNPPAKVILTVSPVPLAATAEPQHVLTSTVYSKSVLRVAAEMAAKAHENVAYFPSYEIVASGMAGNYFAADRRSVTEAGVAHVMRIFAEHYLKGGAGGGAFAEIVRKAAGAVGPQARAAGLEAAFAVMCDEEALDAAAVLAGPRPPGAT
ncbi:MAG: GSCFA domain-containing protein [Methylobacteriaceae bacterium]|nr:GSCFA domain-containing protein [Methylobacteriaceae bacterium]